MKRNIVTLAMVVGILGSLMSAARADSERPDVASRITKYCDPVCELQSQDKAFSLLIEAFRQFQSHQIQNDYQTRLRAAAAMGEEKGSLVISTQLEGIRTLRMWVEALAAKERDLRMEQLQSRGTNFRTAYNCARRVDEEEIQTTVANVVDPKGAGEELKTMRVVALGSPTVGGFKVVKAMPAAKYFYDAPAVEVSPDSLIAPCE